MLSEKKILYHFFICSSVMFLFFACKKTEIIEVPGDPQISGSLIFDGDTTFVKSKNITIRYNSSSPCHPSNEVFFFKVTSTNYSSNATYSWSFGDGKQNATGQFVQHIYDNNTPTTLTLSVLVDNDVKEQITTSIKPIGQGVTPNISYTAQLNDVTIPNAIAFHVNYNISNNASIVKYVWNWNDGSSNTILPYTYAEHFFPEIKKDTLYDVNVTAFSNVGCQSNFPNLVFVPAKFPPSKIISYSKTPACLPDSQVFTFTADTSGLPQGVSFEWWFFDNKPNQYGVKVQHRFTFSGAKDILLIVRRNGLEILRDVASVYALGIDINPIATTDAPQAQDAAKKTWTFNGHSKIGDGHITLKFIWDFGDGVIENNNTPFTTHTYNPASTPTAYQPKLTVIASSGCTDTVVITPKIVIP